MSGLESGRRWLMSIERVPWFGLMCPPFLFSGYLSPNVRRCYPNDEVAWLPGILLLGDLLDSEERRLALREWKIVCEPGVH